MLRTHNYDLYNLLGHKGAETYSAGGCKNSWTATADNSNSLIHVIYLISGGNESSLKYPFNVKL